MIYGYELGIWTHIHWRLGTCNYRSLDILSVLKFTMSAVPTLFRQALRKVPSSRRVVVAHQRRMFGAGQPESQSMQAKLFEAGNVGDNSWEPIMNVTYVATAAILIFGVANKPDTDIASVSILVFSLFLFCMSFCGFDSK